MDSLKKYMLPIFILILFVSLVVSFRSFLMTNIIEPIALLCWAVWRIVSSVDQNAYWMILIVFCLILVFRLVISGKGNTPISAYPDMHKSQNQVEYWQTLIQEAAHGKKESESLRDSLKKLLITVIADEEQADPIDFEEIAPKGQSSLSPAAHQFLFPHKRTRILFSIAHPRNIIFLAPRWLRRWIMKFIRKDNTLIDEILRLMEAELEISYEK